MDSSYPNLFIIGAAKAGTTTLYHALNQHEKVCMSFDKEPMFFSKDEYYLRGIQWYRDTFFPRGEMYPICGEATPHYLYWAEKVAPRITENLKSDQVKFVAIFREPVERAYSWYWNMVREGCEDLSFEEAIQSESGRLSQHGDTFKSTGSMIYGYLKGGEYARQIKHFLTYFPKENFHFLLQEDLKYDFDKAIAGLLSFLGLNSSYDVEVVFGNPSSLPRSALLQRIVRQRSLGKELFKTIIPFPVRHKIKQFILEKNAKRFEYPPMNSDTEAQLREYYMDEVRKLESTIDRDLSHWTYRHE